MLALPFLVPPPSAPAVWSRSPLSSSVPVKIKNKSDQVSWFLQQDELTTQLVHALSVTLEKLRRDLVPYLLMREASVRDFA